MSWRYLSILLSQVEHSTLTSSKIRKSSQSSSISASVVHPFRCWSPSVVWFGFQTIFKLCVEMLFLSFVAVFVWKLRPRRLTLSMWPSVAPRIFNTVVVSVSLFVVLFVCSLSRLQEHLWLLKSCTTLIVALVCVCGNMSHDGLCLF